MGSSSDIRAGRAFVEIYLNKSLLSKGLKAVGSEIKAAGDRITAVGKALAASAGLVTAPILLAAKTWSAAGAEMYRASQRTGMGVEFLSGLKFAANQTGSSFEMMEMSIRKSQKFLGDLAKGSAAAQQTLMRLGLTTHDLAGLSPEKQYEKLAGAIAAIGDPANRTSLAMAVFGRSATQMLPMLAQYDALMQKAARNRRIMSPEDARSAERLEVAFTDLLDVGKGFSSAIGSSVAPMLTNLVNTLSDGARAAVDWVKAHRPAVVQATIFAGAALGLGTAIMGAGYAVSLVGGGLLKLQQGLSIGAHYLGLLSRGFGLFPIAGRMASATLGMITSTASHTWSVLGSLAKLAGSGAMLALRGAGQLGGAGLGLAGRGLSAGAGLAGNALSGAGSLLASGFKAAVPVAGAAMRAIGGAVATGMNVGLKAVGMFVFEFAQGVQGLYRVAAPIPGVLGKIGSAGFSIGRYLSVGLGTAAANAARTAWSASIAGIKVAWFASIAGIKAAWTASVAGVKLAWAAVKAIPSLLSAGYSLAAGLVTTAWTFGAGLVGTAWSFLASIPAMLSTAWGAAASFVALAWSSPTAIATAAWTAFAAISRAVSAAWSAAGTIAGAAWSAAGALAHAAWLWPFALAAAGAAAAAVAIAKYFSPVKAAVKDIAGGLGEAIGGVTSIAQSGGHMVATGFRGAASAARVGFSEAAGYVKTDFAVIWADAKAGFASVTADGKAAFGAISDAIQVGDIQGAISVAVAFGKLEWTKLVNWLDTTWINVKSQFLTVMSDVQAVLTATFLELRAQFVQFKFKINVAAAAVEAFCQSIANNPIIRAVMLENPFKAAPAAGGDVPPGTKAAGPRAATPEERERFRNATIESAEEKARAARNKKIEDERAAAARAAQDQAAADSKKAQDDFNAILETQRKKNEEAKAKAAADKEAPGANQGAAGGGPDAPMNQRYKSSVLSGAAAAMAYGGPSGTNIKPDLKTMVQVARETHATLKQIQASLAVFGMQS